MGDFVSVAGDVIGGLSMLVIGFIFGASVTEHVNRKREARKKMRDQGILKGMTSAEAYLSGFNDAYHSKGDRSKMFNAVGFGGRYGAGYTSGKEKRRAESEHSGFSDV